MNNVEQAFKQVSPIEYEIQLAGRTKTIRIPFAVTEAVFKNFVSSGGLINPQTGEVQQDILQLITSFKAVGDILLTERDEEGKVLKEGNCANLCAEDVIVLFQLATSVVESFIKTLTQMRNPQSQPEPVEKSTKKVSKTESPIA